MMIFDKINHQSERSIKIAEAKIFSFGFLCNRKSDLQVMI
jgi:hypothetical protein